jgi:hypothetical protein
MVNSIPDVIGRVEGTGKDMESVRGETDSLLTIRVPFDGPAIGVATVSVFRAHSVNGDDAGLVFRCTITNDASAFLPHAVLIKGGVDIHVAGGVESAAFLHALHQATAQALLKLGSAAAIQPTTATTPPSPIGRHRTSLRSLPKFTARCQTRREKH